MTTEADLQGNLTKLGLPVEARAWLLDLWNLTQVLDDAMDGDMLARADVSRATWAIFQDMPLNHFYREYTAVLQPVLVLQILKWEGANQIEAAGFASEKSYMWRAGYYDVVLMCCHLCGITNAGHACSELYGETFAEYMGEF